MKRSLLVSALGTVALALAAPAHAQFPGWTDSARSAYALEQRAGYYDARRAAYDTGYGEGLKQGEKDARKGNYFAYEDERTYQRADKGYHRSFGDRERYRQSFRNGYAAGYTQAYQRLTGNSGYGPYDRGRAVPRRQPYPAQRPYPTPYPNTYPGYPNTYPNNYPGGYGGYGYSAAYDNGRNDGYEKGVEDARKNRSFDPLRHKWYRSGDHDYRGQYGPKEQYRDVYRRGFQEGYERGYRGGRYR